MGTKDIFKDKLVLQSALYCNFAIRSYHLGSFQKCFCLMLALQTSYVTIVPAFSSLTLHEFSKKSCIHILDKLFI